MPEVERLLKQIIKDFNDKDAQFMYGYENISTGKPDYKALIKFSKDGVKPLVFGANKEKDLIKQIKDFIESDEPKDINISYHKAQIEIQEAILNHHRKMVADYEDAHSQL